MKTKFYPLIRIMGVAFLMLFSASLWAQNPVLLYWHTKISTAIPSYEFTTGDSITAVGGSSLLKMSDLKKSDFPKLFDCMKSAEVGTDKKIRSSNNAEYILKMSSTSVESIQFMVLNATSTSPSYKEISLKSISTSTDKETWSEIDESSYSATKAMMTSYNYDSCAYLTVTGLAIAQGSYIKFVFSNATSFLEIEVTPMEQSGTSTLLSDIKLGGISLSDFSKNTKEYEVKLPNDASSSPVVSATAEAATGVSVAMLPVSGQVSFGEGETVDTVLITVTETGSDPAKESVYRVIFTKDMTPPTATVNYTDGASLPRSGNIVLTFSEKVSLVSSCTNAVQLNGTDVVGYALDEATSTVLTIPFADGNWNEENTLALSVAAGALVDDYKNTNALIAYSYVFDEAAPQLLSSIPAQQSTTALLKGTITLTFNENIKLSENPGITLKVGTASAVNVAPIVESKKMTLDYGDVNKPNTDYVLTFPVGSIQDTVGNANTEALVLSFKSEDYLNVFPYVSDMSAADFAIPGWMLSAKGYSPNFESGCASAQPGGYRMDNDATSETSQVLDLYLSKAGVVTFNFSSTGNRLYVMSNSVNAKKDTIIVRKNDCISHDYKVETDEFVIVSCYAVLGEMTDDRGNVNVTGTNKTVNVYGVKITAPKHPVEGLTPLLGTATAIAKDGFQAHWTKVGIDVNGYKIYASESKSAIDDALEHKGDNSYYQVLQQTIVGDVAQATLNNLGPKTKYYYFVDAFVIVDQDSIYSLPSKVDSITTLGAPVISEYTESKLPLTASSITVSFDENIILAAGGPAIKMEVDSATSTAVTVTTTVSENVLTLAYSTLQNNTAYRVVIPEGALQGINYANDVDTLYFESVNTEMAPRIKSVVYGTESTPLDGAQAMEINFVASLEVDRPDVERDASVALRLNGAALAASAYQDAFTLHLQGLEYDSTYTLIIPEGAYQVTGSTTLKTAADTVVFKTKILYVEDVVYYTDFATTTTTPMMARYADSIVKYDLANSRIEFTGENQVIDGFTLATSGKKYQIYGYATNSTAGQENNLSYGRFTLNNSSSELTLPTFTGPFKMMWSINNGNTNLRVMALRENTNVLQLDSVGSDEGLPDAKLCYYEFTGTESKTFNFFSQKNAGQLQDLEIIKTVASSEVTPLVNHWKGLVHDSMAPISYADFRFNKRVKLADIAKITATGARIDSVKIFGNSVRPYYRATDDNADVTITIAVGALVQETTDQALQEAYTISFKTRAYFNGKAITQLHRGKDTATINALAIQLSLTDSTAKIDSLVLSFVASEKAVVTVDNVVQVSGKTANDFTSPVSYVVTSEKGETATYVVTISRATSNRKEWSIQSCKIYPNPASTSLFVESENMKEIQILDMSGRIILEKKTVENKERIHVSDFKPGLYFVRMTTTSNQVQVAKFVKK